MDTDQESKIMMTRIITPARGCLCPPDINVNGYVTTQKHLRHITENRYAIILPEITVKDRKESTLKKFHMCHGK